MRNKISSPVFILVCILAAAGCSNGIAENAGENAVTAFVEAVMDGDTVKVSFNEVPDGCEAEEKVRFIGVNTSELYTDPPEYFAREAYEYTDSNLWHRVVRLEFDGDTSFRDRYGRILAYVYVDGSDVSINEKLLVEGYAEYYGYFDFNKVMMSRFKEDEACAKRNKKGRWTVEE